MGMLLLVRHGQASFGAEDYDVLSERGHEQARLLGAWLGERGVVPDLLVRGGLRRHRETLEGLLEGAAWSAETRVEAGWDEFDHVGVVAAMPREQGYDDPDPADPRGFQRLFEQATARWVDGAGVLPEGAETYDDFTGRVRGALGGAVAEAGSGRTVVVVTSGGPIGVCAAALTDPDADRAAAARLWGRFNAVVVNSAVTRVLVGATGTRLLTFNEHPHLVGELLTYR